MKKFLSMMLSLVLLCGLACPVFAASEAKTQEPVLNEKYCSIVYEQIASSAIKEYAEKNKPTIASGMYLYSFDENPIAIYYNLAPKGYAIFDFTNAIVLEYSTETNNPFFTDRDVRYYYNGVFGYYQRMSDGKFINLATKRVVTRDDCLINSAEDFYFVREVPKATKMEISEEPVTLNNSTKLYNCNVAENYSDFYPNFTDKKLKSVPGVCGSVACAIVVAYLDDYKPSLAGSGDFATDWKKTSGLSSENTYGIDLVKEFVGYVEPSGNGSFFLNPGMSSYLSAHNISGGCTLGLLSVYIQTKNAILSDGSGNPLIIGLSNHYCVGTGYKNISKKQIQVNTGWGYETWIDASTVVSTWTMFLS